MRRTRRWALAALAPLLALIVLIGLAHGASAQTYPAPDPTVEDPGDPTEVLGTKFTRSDPGDPAGLPLTGGDVIGLTVIGLGLVATGTVVLRARRHALPA